MPTKKNIKEYLSTKENEMILFDLKEYPNNTSQRLMRNLRIYEPIIAILKFHVETYLDTIEEYEEEDEIPFSDNDKKVLFKCYFILAKFVATNLENQNLLVPFIEKIFFKHILYCPYLKVFLLIEQLFKNNKNLLNNHNLVQKLVKIIINTISPMNFNDINKVSYNNNFYFFCNILILIFSKVIYLEVLRCLIKYKDHIINNNQTSIAIELSSAEYKNVLISYSDTAQLNHLEELSEEFSSNLNSKSFIVNNELNYFTALLYILAISAEDKNHVTETKCQQLFSLNNLNDILKRTKQCWLLRRNTFIFFYHVYLDTERENIDDKEIVLDILKVFF